jgi:preprotein translocase SecE subunit
MAFLEFYKKGQGSLARILALFSCFALAAWGGYSLWKLLQGSDWANATLVTVPHLGFRIDVAMVVAVVVVAVLLFGVVWLMNRPRSVDLLVETEAEMRKVSWPSRQEAWNSSVIVVITVLFLMGLLFFYDVVLNALLRFLFYRAPVAEAATGALPAGTVDLLALGAAWFPGGF